MDLFGKRIEFMWRQTVYGPVLWINIRAGYTKAYRASDLKLNVK